jgi:vacuolar iron transporter family protein
VQHNRESSQASGSRLIFAQGLHGSDLRDWMYGATNGAVTTLVIVAGVVGADLPTMVAPVLGLANLFANGFATAARRYTNTKLARDDYDRSHAKGVWAEDVTAKDYDFSKSMRSPAQAALNTLAAFILCGLIPLIAYLSAPSEVSVCVVATAWTLFAVGAVKSRYSLTAWWRSGLDTLFLGMGAAALAYAAGHTLRLLIDIPTP